MPHLKHKLAIVVIILLISVGYHLISPMFMTTVAHEQLPKVNYVLSNSGATIIEPLEELVSGDVMSGTHPASGRAIIYNNNGQKILRFEDLETMNGPGLSIYLATDTSAEDTLDLGEAEATRGNINYELPTDIDLNKYDTVLIWCDTYNKLYAYAELK
jgi:hypothetical protein